MTGQVRKSRLKLFACLATVCAFYCDCLADSLPKHVQDEIEQIVGEMSQKDLNGQRLLVGMPWAYRNGVEEADEEAVREIVSLLRDYKIGNFQLSDLNYQDWHSHHLNDSTFRERPSAETIKRQIALLRRQMVGADIKVPPIIAVDWEGGQVQHFRHESLIRETPSPMNFTAADRNGDRIRRFGEQSGRLLNSLGVTSNFAPLLDITTENSIAIIGTRSFSSERELVQKMATSFMRGMEEQGVSPVLKHWPGLGGRPEVSGDWNPNVDIHDLDEPLKILRPIDDYNELYRNVLRDDKKGLAAIMTAHVKSEQFRDQCPRARNIVTFCKRIIEEGIREGLGANDIVVFADDVAYLRAVRLYMREFGSGLKNILDAGHDIAIVSSMVPYARQGHPFCADGNYEVDCKPDTIAKGFEQLYALDMSVDSSRESVRRILRWKYRVYKNLLGEDQADEWLDATYSPVPVNHSDYSGEMYDETTRTLGDSVSLIRPTYVQKNGIAADLSLQVDGKIFCVGPTLNINDLELELRKEFGAERVNCIDLPYASRELARPRSLVRSLTSKIETELESDEYSFVIFGVVNKPVHVEILNELIEFLRSGGSRSSDARLIVVAFNSPKVFEDLGHLRDKDYVLAAYSNIQVANAIVVDVLAGTREPAASNSVPVSIARLQVDVPIDSGPVHLPPPSDEDTDKNGFWDWEFNVERINAIILLSVAFVFLFKVLNADVWIAVISVTLGAVVFVTVEENGHSLTVAWLNVEPVWPYFGPLVSVIFAYFFVLTLKRIAPSGTRGTTGSK